LFWHPKSPLSPEDEHWQIECWHWLLSNFGGISALSGTDLILPTGTFFPPTEHSGHERAHHIFTCVAGYMNISVEQFDLIPQEDSVDPALGPLMVVQNAPRSPAGTFSTANGANLRITYDPAMLDRPDELIATLAHELCHPLLLSIQDPPPGGDDYEEFATDLATVYFGFGLFGANNAFSFQQYSDAATGTQGWSTRRLGYLTEPEWGFALAIFHFLTTRPDAASKNHLKPSISTYYRKSAKYIGANKEKFEHLKGARPSPLEAEFGRKPL